MDFLDFLATEFLSVSNLVGYFGGAVTLWGMSSRTMIPLRLGAVAGNIGLLVFGILTDSHPTVVLHAVLLPINLVRLVQMNKLVREIRNISTKNNDMLGPLMPYMTRRTYPAGTVLFNKGDISDAMYFIHAGTIHLEERDVSCSDGEVLGEVAAFSPENRRTATATCVAETVVYTLTNDTVLQLFYQNPTFGLHLTQTIVGRLVRNWQNAEERAKIMA